MSAPSPADLAAREEALSAMRMLALANKRARQWLKVGRHDMAVRTLREAGDPDAESEVLHMEAAIAEAEGRSFEATCLEVLRGVR